MKKMTLPVVAHRIFSQKYDREIVWENSPETFDERRWWEDWAGGLNSSPKWREPEKKWRRFEGAPIKSLDTENGTVRSIDEIRDLFDGGRRSDFCSGYSVNKVWDPAGIDFRLIAIVDEGVPVVRSLGIDHESVIDVARDLNTPKMVNVYFFQNIIGARGVGGWSPDPLQDMVRLVPFAAAEDLDSLDGTVVVLAHELGHLLNLGHHLDVDNLMHPRAWDQANLAPIQIIIARNHAGYYRQALPSLLVEQWIRDRFVDLEEPPLRRDCLKDGRLVLGRPISRPCEQGIFEDDLVDSSPAFGYRLPRTGDAMIYGASVLENRPSPGEKEGPDGTRGFGVQQVQSHALALLNSLEIDSAVVAQLAGLPRIGEILRNVISGTVKATACQRQNAVYALGRIGDPASSTVLLDVLDSTDRSMRIAALVALRALGPDTQIRKRLWQFTRDKSVDRVEFDHARLALGQKFNAFGIDARHRAEIERETLVAPGPRAS